MDCINILLILNIKKDYVYLTELSIYRNKHIIYIKPISRTLVRLIGLLLYYNIMNF